MKQGRFLTVTRVGRGLQYVVSVIQRGCATETSCCVAAIHLLAGSAIQRGRMTLHAANSHIAVGKFLCNQTEVLLYLQRIQPYHGEHGMICRSGQTPVSEKARQRLMDRGPVSQMEQGVGAQNPSGRSAVQ